MSQDELGEFLDSARQLGLLSDDQSSKLRQQSFATRQDAAARLVETQVLTPLQAEWLLAGRGEECVLAGRYFIRQKLGEGAMGAVFLADDRKLGRAVAIKVLPVQSGSDASTVARFAREAKALARLSHPNIVQAYDSDQDAGRQFLVMEYAAGVNLRDLLHARGRIAPALAADYIYQAALGLQEAHEKGLVHRDLKPGNLLLTGNGQLKILDLGLARFLQDHVEDATLTREGTGMGTPDYMPPEQFHDARHVDARSDVYSLGCTLYHLIAGRVPFPGTSFAEKYAAHEQQTPPPLVEFCPDIPAGLALTVERMMAKRSADRFQSAREVAEALFPHVSGSSHAIEQVKRTLSWHGSQLGLSVVPMHVRRRRQILLTAASLAAAACVVMLAFLAGGLARPNSASTTGLSDDDRVKPETQTQATPAVSSDPLVLTVAQDGSAQFRTISEALARVTRPDMTIRVVDRAKYAELIELRDPDRQAGLTIESIDRAVLSVPQDSRLALGIYGVPRCSIRGFVFELTRQSTTGLGIARYSSGTLVERLEFRGRRNGTTAITVDSAVTNEGDPPIVIADCKFDGVGNGIEIVGQNLTTSQSTPLRGLLIRNNSFYGNIVAIWMIGRVSRLFVVSNRVHNFDEAGIRLSALHEGSGQFLIANNTIRGPQNCIQISGLKHAVENVEIVNNLTVAEAGLDLASFETKADFIRQWSITHNRRSFVKPTDSEPAKDVWIAPEHDTVLDKVEWASAELASEDFLTPRDLTATATAGTGGDLPAYVGAIAPSDTTPWDWRKTWDARHPKMRLTVSKDPKAGGEFRTIGEALAQVSRPDMTIQVLDDETYSESLFIADGARHQGLTLEARSKATIELGPSKQVCVFIRNVPRVTIRGFRLRSQQPKSVGVAVIGVSPGVLLHSLECVGKPDELTTGVHIEDVGLTRDDDPVVVQNCRLTNHTTGVRMMGVELATRQPVPCRRLMIRDCDIVGASEAGIALMGSHRDIQVSGNRVWNSETCIYLHELMPDSANILVVNNSLMNVHKCVRIDRPPGGVKQIEIRNNLLLAERGPDMAYVAAGAGADSLQGWRIEQNGRPTPPPASDDLSFREWIPHKNDVTDSIGAISRDPSSPDFLRPATDSPIATQGAGKGDPTLPGYAGAVPPADVERWDWNRTWQGRQEPRPENAKP